MKRTMEEGKMTRLTSNCQSKETRSSQDLEMNVTRCDFCAPRSNVSRVNLPRASTLQPKVVFLALSS